MSGYQLYVFFQIEIVPNLIQVSTPPPYFDPLPNLISHSKFLVLIFHTETLANIVNFSTFRELMVRIFKNPLWFPPITSISDAHSKFKSSKGTIFSTFYHFLYRSRKNFQKPRFIWNIWTKRDPHLKFQDSIFSRFIWALVNH